MIKDLQVNSPVGWLHQLIYNMFIKKILKWKSLWLYIPLGGYPLIYKINNKTFLSLHFKGRNKKIYVLGIDMMFNLSQIIDWRDITG